METKELVIDVLNEAMKAFQANGGKLYPRDFVVDYNPETVKIASFADRHPGWIQLYVTLREGTGCFFLKSETNMFGNMCYIAWEEDNNSNSMIKLFLEKYRDLKNTNKDLFYKYARQVEEELEHIITKRLFQ